MSNRLVAGIGMLILFVGDCFGQEVYRPRPVSPNEAAGLTSVASGAAGETYLLKIEQIEGPAPRIEQPQTPGIPPRESGWVEAAQASSDSVRIVKGIELLVSIDSPFHLKLTDRGNVVELSGRLTKSEIVPARVMHFDASGQQPPLVVGEQRQDFVVEVEYTRVSDGKTCRMSGPIAIRFGKKWLTAPGPRMAGGGRAFPQTMWSVETVKAEGRN